MHSSASIERIKLSRSFELKLKYGDPIFCKKDANIRKRIRNQQSSFMHIFHRLYLKVLTFKSLTKPKWKSFWWQFEWSWDMRVCSKIAMATNNNWSVSSDRLIWSRLISNKTKYLKLWQHYYGSQDNAISPICCLTNPTRMRESRLSALTVQVHLYSLDCCLQCT